MQVVCDQSCFQTRHTNTDVIASQRVGAKRRPMTGSAKQSRGRQTGRWIASSLTLLAMTALPTRKLVAAEPAGDLIQHGVHHASLVAIDKGMRDIDIFGHHDAAGHVLAMLELVAT